MDLLNEKTLHKILAGLYLFVVAVVMFGAGIKAGLFALWLSVAFVIFWLIVLLTIGDVSGFGKNGFIATYIKISVDIFFYKVFMFIVFCTLAWASINVWDFLDKKFPQKTIVDPAALSVFTQPSQNQ